MSNTLNLCSSMHRLHEDLIFITHVNLRSIDPSTMVFIQYLMENIHTNKWPSALFDFTLSALMRLPRESDYEGIILRTTCILVFQILDPVHENGLSESIGAIINTQPHYIDAPSNFREQLIEGEILSWLSPRPCRHHQRIQRFYTSRSRVCNLIGCLALQQQTTIRLRLMIHWLPLNISRDLGMRIDR